MADNDGIEEATDLLVDKVFEVVQEKYPELVRMWKDPNADLEGWTNTLVDILEDEFSFETKLMSKIAGEGDA